MRSALRIGLGFILFALTSCQDRAADVRSARPVENRPKPTEAVRVVHGYLLESTGGFSFRPCDDRSEVWLIDQTGGDLAAASRALGSGPGSRLFIEVTAAVVGAPDSGAGSRYATALSVTQLLRARPAGEGTGCDEPPAPYIYRAAGNEPFWNATVTTDSILFVEPDPPARLAFRATSPERRGAVVTYRVSADGPNRHTLTLSLERGRCTDSMSGAFYSLLARASLDGRTFVGCAREGDVQATLP